MLKNMLAVVFSVVLTVPAFAQTGMTSATTGTTQERAREEIQNVRSGAREQLQNIRENTKQEIQDIREQFEAKRMEAEKMMRAKRDEFEQTIKAKREEAKAKIEAARAELKVKLERIKDERKKQVVERVADNINALNKRMTDHFSNVLVQIEDVLNRVGSRADKAEANGKNVSSVRTAITAAQAAISAARTAVANQAGKSYSPAITTETALKNDVGTLRKTLHDDLKKTQDAVKAAREAVHAAAVGLGQIPKVDDLEVPTSTTTSTNN